MSRRGLEPPPIPPAPHLSVRVTQRVGLLSKFSIRSTIYIRPLISLCRSRYSRIPIRTFRRNKPHFTFSFVSKEDILIEMDFERLTVAPHLAFGLHSGLCKPLRARVPILSGLILTEATLLNDPRHMKISHQSESSEKRSEVELGTHRFDRGTQGSWEDSASLSFSMSKVIDAQK